MEKGKSEYLADLSTHSEVVECVSEVSVLSVVLADACGLSDDTPDSIPLQGATGILLVTWVEQSEDGTSLATEESKEKFIDFGLFILLCVLEGNLVLAQGSKVAVSELMSSTVSNANLLLTLILRSALALVFVVLFLLLFVECALRVCILAEEDWFTLGRLPQDGFACGTVLCDL